MVVRKPRSGMHFGSRKISTRQPTAACITDIIIHSLQWSARLSLSERLQNLKTRQTGSVLSICVDRVHSEESKRNESVWLYNLAQIYDCTVEISPAISQNCQVSNSGIVIFFCYNECSIALRLAISLQEEVERLRLNNQECPDISIGMATGEVYYSKSDFGGLTILGSVVDRACSNANIGNSGAIFIDRETMVSVEWPIIHSKIGDVVNRSASEYIGPTRRLQLTSGKHVDYYEILWSIQRFGCSPAAHWSNYSTSERSNLNKENSKTKLIVSSDRNVTKVNQKYSRKKMGSTIHKTPKSVFLSYFRDDHKSIIPFKEALKLEGIERRWDQNILPGQDWKQEIKKALRRCDAAIVFFSENGLKRKFSGVYPELLDVISRYRSMKSGDIFIIPARLTDCDVPDYEIDGVRDLSSIQYIDLFPKNKIALAARRVAMALSER